MNYLTLSEAAQLARVRTRTVQRWRDNGHVETCTIDGVLRFKRADIECCASKLNRDSLPPVADAEYITIKDAAKHLGYKPQTIRTWIKDGKIHAYRQARAWYVLKSDIDAKCVNFAHLGTDRYLSLAEVMALARIKPRTAYFWRQAGWITAIKQGRETLYERSSVERCAARHANKNAKPHIDGEYITVKDAAQAYFYNVQTIRNWIHDGKVRAYYCDHTWHILKSDIEKRAARQMDKYAVPYEDGEYITIKDAAQTYLRTKQAIWRQIHTGKVRAYYRAHKWYVLKSDVECAKFAHIGTDELYSSPVRDAHISASTR